MLFETTALSEAYPTLVTGVGPLSCVNSLMNFETIAVAEPFPTLFTVVGLLCMNSLLMFETSMSAVDVFVLGRRDIWDGE